MDDHVQIVADIGGTNARFAHVRSRDNTLLEVQVFPCADFTFLGDAIRAYMECIHTHEVNYVCLAVAGPVENDWIDLPNNHWAFSRRELEEALGVPVVVINDFSAQVLCIDGLRASELQWIGTPRPLGKGVKAVIGPGTGLGVSAMMVSGEIVPSEAGHMAFAPVDAHQAELLSVLWERYHRVSVERVLSGPGLANLYWANCRLDGYSRELIAPAVTSGAQAGDPYCLRAVNDFYAILAYTAGDVALMMGAADGVYVSGGIIPRMLHLLDEDAFRRRFQDKGRFREFNSTIPLAIIRSEHPGLLGCVQALRKSYPVR